MGMGSALPRLLLSLAVASVLLVAGGVVLSAASPGQGVMSSAEDEAMRQLVVAVPPQMVDAQQIAALAARYGGVVERWLPRLGLALFSFPIGDVGAAAALADEPLVDFVAEHQRLVRAADVPLDPHWPQQWGPVRVQGPAAWDLAWGDSSVVVAVVDSGVHLSHHDLAGNIWYNPGESGVDPLSGQRTCAVEIATNGLDDDGNGYVDDCRGYDFVFGDMDPTDPSDELGHGTAVAGIAAAATNNLDPAAPGTYEGIAGMARQVGLMAVRVLDSDGLGYAFDVASGIDYAAANGVRVINLSLTFPPEYGPDSPDVAPVRRAIEAAQAADALVVASTGNDNVAIVTCPACFTGVLAVGASTTTDARAYFSNYGERLDLVAPGVSIFSTLFYPGNDSYGLYGYSGSGTSFAAPHAAGAAALVRALRPDLRQDAVHALLRTTSDDVNQGDFDIWTGSGRLNVYRAVAEAIPGLTLELTATVPTLLTGASTDLNVHILTPDGSPAGLGARVVLTSSLGGVTPSIVTVDGTGRAVAHFDPGYTPGVATITATLGPLQTSLHVSIKRALPLYLPMVLR